MIVNSVILYKNFPITGYDNQVYYKTAKERDTAFDKYKSKTFSNVSMLNLSEGTFRTNMTYYVGNMYNYCKIVTDEKNYYCFITGVKWQSNNNCTLYFSIDAWQTYIYDVDFKQCLVEREHVESDIFGDWLADEGLPYYGIKSVKYDTVTQSNFDRGLCLAISDTSIIKSDSYVGNPPPFCKVEYGYSPCILYFEDTTTLTGVISKLVENNLIDSIVGVYRSHVEDNNLISCEVDGISCYMVKNGAFPSKITKQVNLCSSFGGYVPRNNKCFLYPYQYLQISNYSGNSIVYKREEQIQPLNQPNFTIVFPFTEGASCFLYPNNVANGKSKVVSGTTNPEVGWITNQFSAYYSANQNTINNNRQILNDDLQQSRFNNNVNTGTGLSRGLLSVGTAKKDTEMFSGIGGIVSSLLGGLVQDNNDVYNYNKSLSTMTASLNDIKSKGDTLQGQFTPALSNSLDVFGFSFDNMQVSKDCIKMIDNYFDMFGYKIAQIKKPQWTSRKYWNYVKTSGCNVVGNVPCNIIKTIESMFDNGCTIWHDLSYMYKYSEHADGNKANTRS